MENKLEKTLDWGVPIAAAAVTVLGLEALGVSKFLQDYEFAKADVVRQYWGEFCYGVKYGLACASRVLFDAASAGTFAWIAHGIRESRK